MSYHRRIYGIILFCALFVFVSTAAFAAVITLDLPGNSAVSDSDVLKARVVKIVDGQVCLYVSSTSSQPQKFTLKVSGLKPGEQDLYVNGSYKGRKTEQEFVQGTECSTPGRIVNPALFRCVESVRDRIDAAIKRLDGINENEYIRAVNTLRLAADSVRGATLSDQNSRAIELLIVPAGAVPQIKPTLRVKDPAQAAQSYANACSMFQEARDRMYDGITNFMKGDLRNDVVTAMTPIDLKLSYYMVNGKPKGTAVLVNNCDLPVSGDIKISAPAGWAVSAKSFVFSELASGKSFKADFALTPSQKGTAAPQSISAHAAMALSLKTWMAKLTLDASASLPGASTPVASKVKPIPAPSGASTKG